MPLGENEKILWPDYTGKLAGVYLHWLYRLCRSLFNQEQRLEATFFEAVRTVLTRVSGENKPLSLKEINARVKELLKASIQSEGVINLFTNVETERSTVPGGNF